VLLSEVMLGHGSVEKARPRPPACSHPRTPLRAQILTSAGRPVPGVETGVVDRDDATPRPPRQREKLWCESSDFAITAPQKDESTTSMRA
jgi:hypothetical protein